MKDAFFWSYPWDLLDEGPDLAIDRIAGEIGAQSISLATTYHSVAQFRPHAADAPLRFVAEAAAHFQPNAAAYAATRIRPLPAAWMKSRNPLERIADACSKRGVALRAWLVACHSGALASRHPDAACKDAFANRSTTWICPANPDVREYVAGLAADLSTNYPIAAIELESPDFDSGPHAHAHEKIGLNLGPIERLLLSLCFCESCVQSANDADIDAAAVLRSVRVHLAPTIAGQPPRTTSINDFLASDALIRAYTRHRTDSIRALVTAVRRRTKIPIFVHAPYAPDLAGWNPADLGQHCDGFIFPAWTESPESRRARLAELIAAAASPDRVHLGFYCYPPQTADGPTLVRAVHEAVSAGHETIGFYNYGIAPNAGLDWARQAIRFARRDR